MDLRPPTVCATNEVVAIFVLASPIGGVGAFGSPVKTGFSNGAFKAKLLFTAEFSIEMFELTLVSTYVRLIASCAITNPVVASLVLLSPISGV